MYSVTVTIRYGGRTEARQYPVGSTISTVLNDRDLKAVMEWSDNVRALVGGIEQPTSAMLTDGSSIFIEMRANSKAV